MDEIITNLDLKVERRKHSDEIVSLLPLQTTNWKQGNIMLTHLLSLSHIYIYIYINIKIVEKSQNKYDHIFKGFFSYKMKNRFVFFVIQG